MALLLWNEKIAEWNRYSNIISHVQAKHSIRFKQIKQAEYSDNSTTEFHVEKDKPVFFYDSKTIRAHCWIDLIISGLQPFSIVEVDAFRRNMKYSPINRKTVYK